MTAFFVSTGTIKDPDKFEPYAAKARELVIDYGGETILVGKAETAFVGVLDHKIIGIVKFPDHEALNAWYNSDAYQEIIPIRDESADVTAFSYSMR